MTEIMRSFKAKEETYAKFKALLVARGEQIGDVFNDFMEEFVLKNTDKMPTLDKFVDNPEFRILPPFPILNELDRSKWILHLEAHKSNKKYLDELVWSSQTVGALSQKMKDHGITNVVYH